MCQLAAIHDLAFLNPRMTAKGAVAALAIVGAHFGLDFSAATQTEIAAVILLYLGIAGRDRKKGN
jgi:hypothetical protein